MKSVAFVGLGVMGRPMSANLAKAGFDVRTFDARARGSCGSVREAVQGAEALITMLPDGAAVRDVVLDALPHLPGGAMVIDTKQEVTLHKTGVDPQLAPQAPYPLLDDAALRILRLAAPFPPFTEEMQAQTDVLRFVYEWRFGKEGANSSVRAAAEPGR